MKKLLKQYGFNSDMQYYEMIVESYLNGQLTQSSEQFLAMPKKNRKDFVRSALSDWESGLTTGQILNYFFNKL